MPLFFPEPADELESVSSLIKIDYIGKMGSFGEPFLVKPFCAVMSEDEDWLARSRLILESEWGPVDQESEIYQVSDYTDYYQLDMQGNILKQFFSFEELRSVEDLNQHAKFRTNDLEHEHSNCAGSRQINLDPGYLTLDKFVLYTTKNFNHRLYLHDGLFAEVTLSYRKKSGRWEKHPYTYPDYSTAASQAFFLAMRDRLTQQLKQHEELS